MAEKTTQPDTTGMKELRQYGIPAGLIVAVVLIIQVMGIPYGQEAAQRETDQALRFERLEAEVRATRTEVGQLREEIRQNSDRAISAHQFQLWVYKFRNENRGIDISIPDLR